MRSTWPALDPLIGAKIAAKRRARLKALHAIRDQRRLVVAAALAELSARPGGPPRGWQAEVARRAGVHRSVITRDVQALLAEAVA